MTDTSFVRHDSLRKMFSNKSFERTFLRNLDVELTERCNNACIHCAINLPQDDAIALKRELQTPALLGLIAQAAEAGVMQIRFTGGEPLLRADFADVYLHTRKAGITVTIATNARLITKEIADLLVRIPPREPIEISVYGICRKSYEEVTRAEGSFEEFIRGVSLLKDRGLPMTFSQVILPPNKNEASGFDDWLHTIVPDAPRARIVCDLHLRFRRDSEALNQKIRHLRMSPEEILGILHKLDPESIEESREFCRNFLTAKGDKLFSCGILDGGCIDPYGFLRPCLLVFHPDFLIDITRTSLREGVATLREKVMESRGSSSGYQKRCTNCFLHNICDHCPGRSWSEHGVLDTPVDYACEIAHAEMHALGLLKKGEAAWMVGDWKNRMKAMNRR